MGPANFSVPDKSYPGLPACCAQSEVAARGSGAGSSVSAGARHTAQAREAGHLGGNCGHLGCSGPCKATPSSRFWHIAALCGGVALVVGSWEFLREGRNLDLLIKAPYLSHVGGQGRSSDLVPLALLPWAGRRGPFLLSRCAIWAS